MNDQVKSLLTVTAAAAAAASIAFVQKTRAPSYAAAACSKEKSDSEELHKHCTHSMPNKHAYHLFDIDYSMHVEHREKLFNAFLTTHPHANSIPSAIILQGGSEIDRYDTDTQYAFRQESFFRYLFGVREPDCIGLLDLSTRQSILFVPRLSDEWELWCGERKSLSYFRTHYQVDKVYYIDELIQIVTKLQQIYVLKGMNSDSGLETVTTFQLPKEFNEIMVNDSLLHPILVQCRLIKSEKELNLLRFINKLSSKAHIEVMKSIQPGLMEFHAESYFLHYCYSYGGARLHAYTCICGSGHNGSALHYGHAGAPNDKQIEDGELFLNDMGAELHGYASDITCTFPVNGVFTSDQRMIYEGVLHAHDAILAAIQPGVSYIDMHVLSHRVLTQHLLECGLFQNGTVDELMDHELSAYFYPHGLGHLMGLDVHDVGGIPIGSTRPKTKLLQKLRCIRVLEPNMVLTVEPGCYFIEAQIKDVLANPITARFVNQEMLQRFRGMGGVRIESDIIVTKTGMENMTKVPRTIVEIETLMATKQWP